MTGVGFSVNIFRSLKKQIQKSGRCLHKTNFSAPEEQTWKSFLKLRPRRDALRFDQLFFYKAERLLEHPDDTADQHRGQQRSLPDAADLLEPAEGEENRNHHDGDVKADFGGAECDSILFRDGPDETVARHVGDVRQKLERDSGRQQRTAQNLFQQLERIVLRNVEGGDPHAEIDEESESEKCRQLRQPCPMEPAPQNRRLHQNKEKIDGHGRHSQGPGKDEGHYVGETCDGGGPQARPGAEGDPESGEHQSDEEYKKALSFTVTVFHGNHQLRKFF